MICKLKITFLCHFLGEYTNHCKLLPLLQTAFSIIVIHLISFNRVKLEGHNPSTLQIKGNVVEGSLEILSPSSDEPVDCVQFGTTYYGTDKTESAILFNNGPEPVCFVAVLDEDALGQEVVSLLSNKIDSLNILVQCSLTCKWASRLSLRQVEYAKQAEQGVGCRCRKIS